MEKWEHLYGELVRNAPECACGCGERVRPLATSLELFIAHGNRRYSRHCQGHDKRPKNWNVELDTVERQAVLGTLLGDSSLLFPNRRSAFPRLVTNHGEPQREWVYHKAALLHRFNPHVSEADNRGYGSRWVRMATSCLPCLAPIHQLVVREGRKRITSEWLDALGPVGLAWWIGDDGGSTGNGFVFNTHGCLPAEVELVAAWFRDSYGPTTVHYYPGYPTLYVSAEARRRFLPLVEPHLPHSMQYKLRACRLRPKRRQ